MAIPAGRFQAAGSANKCKVSKEFGTLLIINEEDAQMKMQETLQKIVNEGSGGLICIIL